MEVVDVSLVESRLGLACHTVFAVFTDRYVVTRKRETDKTKRYATACQQQGYRFRPVVLTTLGAMGSQSRQALRVATGAACPANCSCNGSRHGKPEMRRRFRRWMESIAFAMVRGMTRAIHTSRFRWQEVAATA